MIEKKRLRLLPIGLTMAASLLLTVGSFFGCAKNFMGPQTVLSQFCFFGFFVFGVSFVVAAIWLLVAIVLNFFRTKGDSQ
jgi:hypothetical protein